ncbi:MAG: ATP-binding protein [Patescibacteria group bacterium]
MSINIIIQSTFAIFVILVGVSTSLMVFSANRRSKANIYLSFLIIVGVLIILLDFTTFFAPLKNVIQIERVVYGFLPISVGALYLVSLNFPEKIKHNIFASSIIAFYVVSFSALSLFSDTIIADVKRNNWGIEIIGGQLELFFSTLSVLAVIAIILSIFRRYSMQSRMNKRKIQVFLYGIMVFIIAEAICILLLPIFHLDQFSYLGDYSIIIFFIFTAYAIVKHRLMDIRTVVARSVAFIILLALIGAFYTFTTIWLEKIIFGSEGSISWGQIAFRIAVALIVIFSFQPLRKFIIKKTDKIFFKQSYEPDELLEELSRTMGSSIVLIELLYKVLSILTEEMKVSRGFFVILKDEKTIDTTQGVGYKRSPSLTLKEIEILCKEGVTIYDELDENSKKKPILRKHDASISIPLRTNNKFSGVLLLGEKSSGDMYSAQDISIFEILGPEVTVAIENAKSYEEIQQFNAVLRTEIQKATKDLESANHNLRELDKAKDEFISMASHQLRTPLTAIKGYLSMLLEGDAGEIKVGQYEFVQEAYYGATRMVSLINDLLNVSRMETGRFFLEVTEFDLTKTVEEEVKQLEKVSKDKGIKLVYQKHGHVSLCADEMKVRQVVMNFIDNAIYYTLNGKVIVNLYDEGKNVRFEVSDNGIGVPKEQQKHLFTKFYRAANARSTRPDGTGLGLFMAKKVIEEHHGEIIFRSVEGKGSTFGFRMPKVSKVAQESTSPFDPSIPLATPIDKAIKVMDEKIKEDAKEDKEPVVVGK